MTKKTAKLIACLEAELLTAIASKNAASDLLDEDRFDAACIRVRDIEHEIWLAHRGKFAGCSSTRELVSNNID
jgi:hypothetical protein